MSSLTPNAHTSFQIAIKQNPSNLIVMADLCLADRRDDRKWIHISAYRLPYQVVTDFLRQSFGENHFHVALFEDQYKIKLPRALKKTEHDQLEDLRGPLNES